MAASRAARWSALPCSGSWPTIEAGRVDVVVVYKVDRLTRSLADFAKLVELFDEHGVSFVSVTQAFNTTTSMGRLTLNVLLSFAQFEREVTGERIRDKIAASKRKGIWMGGVVPLGYESRDRSSSSTRRKPSVCGSSSAATLSWQASASSSRSCGSGGSSQRSGILEKACHWAGCPSHEALSPIFCATASTSAKSDTGVTSVRPAYRDP